MKARLQPVLFLAAAHFLNASCLHFYVLPSRRLSCFSLSIHILWTESFFSPYEFEIESNWMFDFFRMSNFLSAPARASVVVHGPACLCWFISFAIQFVFVSINAMAILLSWRRGSILHPSERMSSILPQDHGVLANIVFLYKFNKFTISSLWN